MIIFPFFRDRFGLHRGVSLAGLLLLLLTGTACNSQPAVREVTVVQTVLQTLEVTRIIEGPVTVTPTPTPDYSPTYTSTATETPTPFPTSTPTSTPTYSAPRVKVLMHSACLNGPGVAYLYKYDLLTGTPMEVLGWQEILSQNKPGVWEPTVWLYIQALGGTNPCWILSSLVQVAHGNINDTPQYTSRLPLSRLYEPPNAVDAWRNGNEVTIMWSSVWMTEDDYRGYLVEAWVCHAGQIYFTPVSWVGLNIANPAVIIPDEPGCSQPSSGRVYTVEKHGYTQWRLVTWPSF
jgi:hypothetical protein